jgi:HD domain-containing protein
MDASLKVNRDEVVAGLGGEEAVRGMDHDARADALEEFLSGRLDAIVAARQRGKEFPTVTELADKVDTRGYRRGTGKLFMHDHRNIQNPDADKAGKTVRRLAPMPAKPTLVDFFKLRFPPAAHLLQSARLARKNGLSEEIILACLVHDIGQYLCFTDHGYWGAQIVEPYVSERVAFAIKYHQALRFYPDQSVGYGYPEGYLLMFGTDYVPPPHVQAAYSYARNHKWYMDARMVTTNDLYSFDPSVVVEIEEFTDVIGRHFKQPKEGLGNDNTPVSHMWRTMVNPDAPL